jgi:hypothetical protein
MGDVFQSSYVRIIFYSMLRYFYIFVIAYQFQHSILDRLSDGNVTFRRLFEVVVYVAKLLHFSDWGNPVMTSKVTE